MGERERKLKRGTQRGNEKESDTQGVNEEERHTGKKGEMRERDIYREKEKKQEWERPKGKESVRKRCVTPKNLSDPSPATEHTFLM